MKINKERLQKEVAKYQSLGKKVYKIDLQCRIMDIEAPKELKKKLFRTIMGKVVVLAKVSERSPDKIV